MSIKVITPATAEPLSLTEVKEFLRVDSSDEDATLNIMISAAREMCETYTRQILMTTTIDEVGDAFPSVNYNSITEYISLSRSPIQSITSVSYLDDAGATQTVSSSDYTSDLISQPSRLDPVTSWPTASVEVNAVTIRYVVGYTSASDVPAPIRQGIMLAIASMYENRMDGVKRFPTASEYLWNPFRIFTF